MLANLGVEIDALDLDEARLAIREAGAGDRARHVLGRDRQLDVAVEHARLVALDLGDDDAAFLTMIGADTMLTSETCGRSAPARAALISARVFIVAVEPVEQDLHLLDRIFGDLADKGAEHFGELDEGLSRGASSA